MLLVESYGCWETDHARQQELLGAGVGMLVEIATGVQLDVALSGDESADPLLMVCATSLSYRSWGPLAEALAESFRLIRYDHRGIGSSERGHGSIWMASLAADAAALLDALQVQRAHVLGWSWAVQWLRSWLLPILIGWERWSCGAPGQRLMSISML